MTATNRDRVLEAVRRATAKPARHPAATESPAIAPPVMPPLEEGLLETFVREATAVGCHVVSAPTDDDADLRQLVEAHRGDAVLFDRSGLAERLGLDYHDDPKRAWHEPDTTASLFAADGAIAATGSLVLDADARPTDDIVTNHTIYILRGDTLVPYLQDLPPSTRGCRLLVTGPARTADIEKRLVMGAHGPARVTILVLPGEPAGTAPPPDHS